MKRNALRAVLVNVLWLALGSQIAGAVELRQREAAPAKAAAEPEVVMELSVDQPGSGGIDATDLARIIAPATDGTYTGTVAGKPFSLTVSGNKITGWQVQNLICPSFTITQASVSGANCTIAGNNSFNCGGLGCTAAGNMRIIGSFSGNTASGTFDLDVQPPGFPCCSFRNLSLTATRAGASPPAAPSNLVATATSDDEIELDWNDNSNNETQFRVEMRQGTSGSFTDIGSAGANATGVSVVGLDPATLYQFRVRARNADGDSAYSNTASATTFGGPTGPCVPSATAMCLNNNRFRVEAQFATGDASINNAQVVKLTDDTGYLWFFSSTNVEIVVKVLNGCSDFGGHKYWVFAAGLTNTYVNLTVTDTATGAVKSYENPLNRAYPPLQDTSAFATCP